MADENAFASTAIRHARSADSHKIISGINAICSEGGAFYTSRFVHTPEWDAVLYCPEAMPDHVLAVAEWDGKIAGAGRLFPGSKFMLMNHTAELGMFVLKPFRRQGLGTKLVNWLVHWAVQEKIEKITLTVFATNAPAVQFFRKQGFIRSGRMRRQVKTADGYVDLLFMELFLF